MSTKQQLHSKSHNQYWEQVFDSMALTEKVVRAFALSVLLILYSLFFTFHPIKMSPYEQDLRTHTDTFKN